MTCGSGAPPLPPPPAPAIAARLVSEAALAAARAWAQPLDAVDLGRALSQLYSILRDLGLATRGLARYQTVGYPAEPVPADFALLLETSAQRLLHAGMSLDGVVAAEGLERLLNPDEPGVTLCRAARGAIVAWRKPAGTSDERDVTILYLATTLESLTEAALSLAACAPRQRAIALRTIAASLTVLAVFVTRATQPPLGTDM